MQAVEQFASAESVATCPTLQRFLSHFESHALLFERPMDKEELELLLPTAASVLTSALNESSIDAVQGMLLYLKRQQTLITDQGLSWLFQQLWKVKAEPATKPPASNVTSKQRRVSPSGCHQKKSNRFVKPEPKIKEEANDDVQALCIAPAPAAPAETGAKEAHLPAPEPDRQQTLAGNVPKNDPDAGCCRAQETRGTELHAEVHKEGGDINTDVNCRHESPDAHVPDMPSERAQISPAAELGTPEHAQAAAAQQPGQSPSDADNRESGEVSDDSNVPLACLQKRRVRKQMMSGKRIRGEGLQPNASVAQQPHSTPSTSPTPPAAPNCSAERASAAAEPLNSHHRDAKKLRFSQPGVEHSPTALANAYAPADHLDESHLSVGKGLIGMIDEGGPQVMHKSESCKDNTGHEVGMESAHVGLEAMAMKQTDSVSLGHACPENDPTSHAPKDAKLLVEDALRVLQNGTSRDAPADPLAQDGTALKEGTVFAPSRPHETHASLSDSSKPQAVGAAGVPGHHQVIPQAHQNVVIEENLELIRKRRESVEQALSQHRAQMRAARFHTSDSPEVVVVDNNHDRVSCGHAATLRMSPCRSSQLENSPIGSPEVDYELAYPQTSRHLDTIPWLSGQENAALQRGGNHACSPPLYSTHSSPLSRPKTPGSPPYCPVPAPTPEYDPNVQRSNATPADRVVYPPQPSAAINTELRQYAEDLYLRLRCEGRFMDRAALGDRWHQGGCLGKGGDVYMCREIHKPNGVVLKNALDTYSSWFVTRTVWLDGTARNLVGLRGWKGKQFNWQAPK